MKKLAKHILAHTFARIGPHAQRRHRPRLWILMYHRILPKDDPRANLEEPGMLVTPDTFRKHLEWAGSYFDFIRLHDWVERIASGRGVPPRACVITFDDGWLDNYQFAYPILQDAGIPATIFVVSDMIGTDKMFWPNRLSRLLLHAGPRADREPSLEWLRRIADRELSAGSDAASRAAIIAACKRYDDRTIHQYLSLAEGELRLNEESERALMNWQELDELQNSGLVDIGSHTKNHYRLNASLSRELIEAEIVESKACLEQRLGRDVELFCYPNGDYDDVVAELVRHHYAAAVTTTRGINDRHSTLSALSRIGVHESISSSRAGFLARLSGWM